MAAKGLNIQTVLPAASVKASPQPRGNARLSNSKTSLRAAFCSTASAQHLLKGSRQNSTADRLTTLRVCAVKEGAVLDRKLRVAVIGGGPSGACTAETLAKGGCETYLIERKLDNCKVRAIMVSFRFF
jgi:thioredoxin reductase